MTTTVYKEGTNASDTVTLTGCTNSLLTLSLTNSGQTYTLSESDELDLELASNSATLTLSFEYGPTWPDGYSVQVKFDNAEKPVPHVYSDKPTDSKFSIVITTPTGGLIVWDPKIKVIPPVRGG